MNTFDGIPAGAFGFYADLEQNNNRDWWLEHKARYETLVREPLAALLAELEPRFGPAKIFRPNRDIRFSQDKSPYKTAQGAVASFQEGVGYYVQLSADGLLVGGRLPFDLARPACPLPELGGCHRDRGIPGEDCPSARRRRIHR